MRIKMIFTLKCFAILMLASVSAQYFENCGKHKRGDCKSCNSVESFRILQLNIWGVTYFKDQPIPSADEPYNITAVVAAIKAMGASLPNPYLALLNLPEAALPMFIPVFNPSLKKEIRLKALCDYLNHEKFDFVFLQELWYLKDYNILAQCTRHNYHISTYDSQYCGAANGMVALNCSGVVTLSKYPIRNQRYVDLYMGNASTETIFDLYFQQFSQRKVLYVDTYVKGCKIRLVNTHTLATYNQTSQNRDVRVRQVGQLLGGLGCKFDLAILGADLNDSPLLGPTQPYGLLIQDGFENTANPGWKSQYHSHEEFSMLSFFPTYSNQGNTWSGDNTTNYYPQTIDYIMTKGTHYHNHKSFVKVEDFKVIDLKTRDSCDCSLTDHSAVLAKIKPRCQRKD